MIFEEHLYSEKDSIIIVEKLGKYGISAKQIGTLPSNHDVDILITKVPDSVGNKQFVFELLGCRKVIKDKCGYVCIVDGIGVVHMMFVGLVSIGVDNQTYRDGES